METNAMETRENQPANQHILLVGGGSIGGTLAKLLGTNNQITVLKRSPPSQPDSSASIDYLIADLTLPEQLNGRLPGKPIDQVVIAVAPSEYTEEAYRALYVDGVRHFLDALHGANHSPNRVLFVSSTSVYHQTSGEWVDEDSPTHPETFSGRQLLEAEQQILHAGFPATIVRCSGIYGNHRTRLLDQVIQGNTHRFPLEVFSNRIHEADAIGFLAHLCHCAARRLPLSPIYLATDSEPVRYGELFAWLSQTLTACGLRPPENNPDREDEGTRPLEKSRRRGGNKRCSNQRMRSSGYLLKYPTFREGYKAMIESRIRAC